MQNDFKSVGKLGFFIYYNNIVCTFIVNRLNCIHYNMPIYIYLNFFPVWWRPCYFT